MPGAFTGSRRCARPFATSKAEAPANTPDPDKCCVFAKSANGCPGNATPKGCIQHSACNILTKAHAAGRSFMPQESPGCSCSLGCCCPRLSFKFIESLSDVGKERCPTQVLANSHTEFLHHDDSESLLLCTMALVTWHAPSWKPTQSNHDSQPASHSHTRIPPKLVVTALLQLQIWEATHGESQHQARCPGPNHREHPKKAN